MGVPFPARKPSSNVPLKGVSEHGGTKVDKKKKAGTKKMAGLS